MIFISFVLSIAQAALVVAAMLVQFFAVIFVAIFSLVVSLWIHRGDWIGNSEKESK